MHNTTASKPQQQLSALHAALVLRTPSCRYFAAMEVEDCWCVYPWDAEDIYAHTQVAEAAGAQLPATMRGKRQSSGCPLQASNGGSANGAHECNGQVANGAAAAVVSNGSHA